MTLREQKDERDRHNIAHTYWRMGKEAGREEGLEEGRREERVETAKKLLAAGVDVSIIARATGLSTEIVQSL